jgi:hypothetical protein
VNSKAMEEFVNDAATKKGELLQKAQMKQK